MSTVYCWGYSLDAVRLTCDLVAWSLGVLPISVFECLYKFLLANYTGEQANLYGASELFQRLVRK
ncbi:MAG: hypothetical protein CMB79_08900 [Filomicrobium sp.]|nr:hypothetical protein [Filomicrobium sp.]